MDTIVEIVKYLPKYLDRLLKAWVVWIWSPALEVLTLIVDTFVPSFSPPRWLYVVIAGVGFVIANVKLLLESEKRLGAYEYQAPEYELDVTRVDPRLPKGSHIEIECEVSIRPTTSWIGHLSDVTGNGVNPVRGLGDWTVYDVRYTDNKIGFARLPYKIARQCGAIVTVLVSIDEQLDPRAANEWKNVRFPLAFIFQYFTQPVGDVQKLMTLSVQADLSDQAPVVLEHQRRKAVEAQ